MIATSGFLTALECTKSIFGRGSAPDPAGGKEREGRGREGGEGKGRRGCPHPNCSSWIRPCGRAVLFAVVELLVVNTVSDKVVSHSLAYLFVQKCFAGDVPYYMKIWPKLTKPFKNADFQSIFARSLQP